MHESKCVGDLHSACGSVYYEGDPATHRGMKLDRCEGCNQNTHGTPFFFSTPAKKPNNGHLC